MKHCALALLLLAAHAAAEEPVRVLLAVGNNLGDPGDTPLHFAEADAQRFAQLMVDIGDVRPERVSVALGESAPKVRERLAELKGRVEELHAAGHQVVLMLYLSSHAKDGALHLAGTRLPLAELRDFAESTAAQLRLVFVDACDSGQLAREKGGRAAPEFQISLEGATTRGQVLISSSGPTEAAQEWDLYQGSLFTHHLLTGLRGDADADRDGEVTLIEAYQYTWRRTVAEAAQRGQHPNFDFDLTGSSALVLSRPKVARAAVVFPAALAGHFVVVSQPQPDVVSELEKQGGQPLRLALPPGRYLIRQLLGTQVGLLDFELPFGGEYQVQPERFQRRSFAEVATKGGYVEVRPWQLSLGGTAESEQLDGLGPRVRGTLALRRSVDAWLGGVGLGVGGWSNHQNAVTTHELNFEPWVELGYRFLGLFWTPSIGLAGGLDVRRQSYRRDRETEFEALGFQRLPDRWSTGAFLGPFVGAELSLGQRLLLGARVAGQLRWLNVENASPWSAVVQGELHLGVRF